MDVFAGVDVGNRTTEVAVATSDGRFLASAMVPTTGIKGTRSSAKGIVDGLARALSGLGPVTLREIVLCETAPVVFNAAVVPQEDLALLTSHVLAHNPDTPGGAGVASGRAARLGTLAEAGGAGGPVIALVDRDVSFGEAAARINDAVGRGAKVVGVAMEADEAVLLWNRLGRKVPVIDEVRGLSRIADGTAMAVEVAPEGGRLAALTDPFALAELIDHDDADELRGIALTLTELRSGVVVKAEHGMQVQPNHLVIQTAAGDDVRIRLDEGAGAVNRLAASVLPARSVRVGLGGSIQSPFPALEETFQDAASVVVRDMFAVDAWYQAGASGRGTVRQGGIGLSAAMSDEGRLFGRLAADLRASLDCKVLTLGREAQQMVRGALTTPRLRAPCVIADIGAGSIDLVLYAGGAPQATIELSGAGDLVDAMLGQALGIADLDLVERLKRHPVGRVERRGIIRLQNGAPVRDDRAACADLVGKAVLVTPDAIVPLAADAEPAEIVAERRRCKEDVIVANLLRGFARLPIEGARIHVALVGGGACDDELVMLAREALGRLGVTVGRANVRGTEGPRNCVATGLVLSRLAMQP